MILREEIVRHVKNELDVTLSEWGYKLLDLQINEIKFDEAEREASKLRGQDTALFREEVARGISKAAKEIKAADLDPSFILFSMWLE